MITRAEYMKQSLIDGKKAHTDYYEQFSASPIHWIKILPNWQRITQEARKSRDEHLNDIPLNRWDMLMPVPIPFSMASMLKLHGDYMTKAVWVCIAKCAVLKYIRENPEEVNHVS